MTIKVKQIDNTELANFVNSYVSGEFSDLQNQIDDQELYTSGVSGLVNLVSGQIQIVSGNVNIVSGLYGTVINSISGDLNIISGNIATISGNVSTVSGNVNTLSGKQDLTSGRVNTLSGNVNTLSGDYGNKINILSGNLNTTSGVLSLTSGKVDVISGKVDLISGRVNIISGNLNTVSGNVSNLSGVTVFITGDQTISGVKTFNSSPILPTGSPTGTSQAANKYYVDISMPPGIIFPYAGTGEPLGYLFCYGQAINRTTYANLFGVVGTTYGTGNGSTTFNVPDLRGRIAAGRTDMGGSVSSALSSTGVGAPTFNGGSGVNLGATVGVDRHTITTPQTPSHSHGISFPYSQFIADVGAGGNVASTGGGTTWRSNANFVFSTNSTGGGEAHPNVQPSIILNYIIKF